MLFAALEKRWVSSLFRHIFQHRKDGEQKSLLLLRQNGDGFFYLSVSHVEWMSGVIPLQIDVTALPLSSRSLQCDDELVGIAELVRDSLRPHVP